MRKAGAFRSRMGVFRLYRFFKRSIPLFLPGCPATGRKKAVPSRRKERLDEKMRFAVLTDFRAAQQVGAFFHGEAAGLHVPDDAGLLLEFAAVGGDLAFYVAVDAHVSGGDVALDLGGFSDGDFSLVGNDFTFDFAVDVHVVLETDGSLDFNAGGEEVCYVVCHCRKMVGDGWFWLRWS